MDNALRCQAVPSGCRFYARLQEDWAFLTLLMTLFSHGRGIFDFLASEPDKAEEVLAQAIARHPATLGAEFRAEVERTREEFPGIESQVVTLEEWIQVSGRLEGALTTKGRRGGWGHKIVQGDLRLLPGKLVAEPPLLEGWTPRVVSSPMARKGAQILRTMPPASLFEREGWEGRCRDDYRRWRRFYLAAAQRSDVLLVRTLVREDSLPRPCPYCWAPLPTENESR